MTHRMTRLVVIAALLAAMGAIAIAAARDLGARDARDAVAELLGTSKSKVHVKSISPGLVGKDTVVVVETELAFQFHQNADDDWEISSVRLGAGEWEDLQLIRQALDREKSLRAAAELRTLASGVEAHRRERGYYPKVDSVASLVDLITPRFVSEVIRVDPWNRPYLYEATGAGYRLASAGPDGEAGTGDDVVETREGATP